MGKRKINHKKTASTATIFLFCFLLVILFFRSFIFLKRTISDISSAIHHQNVEVFLPSIQPCHTAKKHITIEERQLLNYRSLGVQCKK